MRLGAGNLVVQLAPRVMQAVVFQEAIARAGIEAVYQFPYNRNDPPVRPVRIAREYSACPFWQRGICEPTGPKLPHRHRNKIYVVEHPRGGG
jgi:hypothetical protein